MQRFSKILLVADTDREKSTAFLRAIDLAGSNQADLTIVDVVQEIPDGMQMAIVALQYNELVDIAVAERRGALEKFTAICREGNVIRGCGDIRFTRGGMR